MFISEANLADPVHQYAIVALVNSYAHDGDGRSRDLPDEVRQRMISGLREHPTTLIYLAFDGEEAVGVAVCFIGFSTFAARPLINIHDLVVLPQCRGRGVGRMLMGAVEARGSEMGCSKLTLEVLESNQGARRLYRNLGFGQLPDGSTKPTTLFMEKYLPGESIPKNRQRN